MNDDYIARLFRKADSNGNGRVAGAQAIDFFRRSLISIDLLTRLWDAVDSKKNGYLEFEQV